MVEAPPFQLVRISDRHSAVELWSTVRLPFEPKRWVRDMRSELRDAVRELRAGDGRLLHALFVSAEAGVYDMENVLLYNVGSECFRDAMANGVRFERAHVRRMPDNAPRGFNHFHRYAFAGRGEGFLSPAETLPLARWSTPLRPLVGPVNAATIWWAVTTGDAQLTKGFPTPASTLELRVKLQAPPGAMPRVAPLLKPLLDGIVAAFHAHDGSEAAALGARIAGWTGATESEVIEQLTDSSRAPLGNRRLLWRWREGVQWNPADDLLTACELVLVRGPRWELSGELSEVLPTEVEMRVEPDSNDIRLLRRA